MDAATNNSNHTMEKYGRGHGYNFLTTTIMDMGVDIIANNNDDYTMGDMGVGMDVIDDDNDNFSNDDDYFTPAATPTNGIVCNALLFLHCNYLCHHNFNVPPQSRPNIHNYLFHHSSCIHWL